MGYIFSLLAALFSGLTTIFAKLSVTNVSSTLSTGLRTFVILIFSVIIFLFFGNLSTISTYSLIFIILSGITTFLLWITYFKALSLADVSLVTPLDKLSIILTLILSCIFFKEKITIIKLISMLFMILGAFLMVKKEKKPRNNYIIYSLLTAFFTSLATILGKFGLKDVDSLLATTLRTLIVFIILIIYILVKNEYKDIKKINKKDILYIILSGLSTCLSWTFYFIALKDNDTSTVFTIEKLSAGVAILFSIIFLNESPDKRGIAGFILILLSTLMLILFN